MKSTTRVSNQLLRIICIIGFLNAPAHSQINQIDPSKLPQDAPVQSAYQSLLPIEQYARTYESTWRFPISKSDMAARLSLVLKTLEEAQQQSPSNKELQLFTGLVAHLAYNLDIQEAYIPAMNLLGALAPQDYRAAWFLGIHQCQSNDTIGGMQHLLGVEVANQKLSGDFWRDYANCASVTFMPAHAVRAYDIADTANGGPVDPQLEQIARNRIKPSSNTNVYTDRQAWSEIETGKTFLFTSTLCGLSFEAPSTDAIQIGSKIENGACYAGVETPRYKTHTQPSSATLAIHSEAASPGQTLASFAHSYLNKPDFASVKTTSGLPCPASECLDYELITNKIYYLQGGAHALLLFFASEPPQYPGLKLERPIALPKPDHKSSGPAFYRPQETFQRFPGTRYFVIILDANEDIYKSSRADFDDLLKSLVVDSK
jgi:hypothetical protein